MNRLQKKCFIAATGLHLFLVLILFIGPAFITTKSDTQDVPVIDILNIPEKTTDENIFGGGPKGSPPPAQPIPPAPQPQQVQQPVPPVEKTPPQPPPVKKEMAKEVTPPDEKVEVKETTKTSKNKIEISDKVVTRRSDPQAAAKARAQAEAQAATERQRIAAAVSSATRNIANGVSSATEIKIGSGDGSGGPSYGNWNSAVRLAYMRAWVVPDGVTDDTAKVATQITVARDGTVVSAKIIRFSGNGIVDHSVQATLDRVRQLPQLPDSAKEDQRTVTITFDVKAKQGLG